MFFNKLLLRKIKVLQGKLIELEDENRELKLSNRGLKAGNTRMQGVNDLLKEKLGSIVTPSFKRDPNDNEIMDD